MKGSVRLLSLAFAVATVMLFSCKKDVKEISIENNSSLMRVDEAVVISRVELESQYGGIPADKFVMLVAPNGDKMAVQHDDISGDGQWDELFFLINMDPQSVTTYTLSFVDDAELPYADLRTNIRFAGIVNSDYIPMVSARRLGADEGLAAGVYQFEGPGWENDRVGFRNYFDIRNGIDIFGKLTPDMILNHVGVNENYHVLQEWGMDILKVGASLGAGALALEVDGILHRVAPGAAGSYELITQGPLRSVFRLRFDNWVIDDQTYSLVHDISIWGGAWFYESKVYLEGHEGRKVLVTGITSLDLEDKDAYLEIISEGVVTFGTHGEQAIEGEMLGMAVMVDQDAYVGYKHVGEGDDITNTFMINMDMVDSEPVSFRYYSCWELSEPRFFQPEYFYEFLEYERMKRLQPLDIRLR